MTFPFDHVLISSIPQSSAKRDCKNSVRRLDATIRAQRLATLHLQIIEGASAVFPLRSCFCDIVSLAKSLIYEHKANITCRNLGRTKQST